MNLSPAMAGVKSSDLAGQARLTPGNASGPDGLSEPDIGRRFEQMLWAEMLSHAGLETAFTRGGGEAASAFSRYIVEAIAADLAETHPLGLGQKVNEIVAARDMTGSV